MKTMAAPPPGPYVVPQLVHDGDLVPRRITPDPLLAGAFRLRILTFPNAVTLVRTAVAVPLALASIAHRSMALLIVAYAMYWVGDIMDGWVARRLGQETRLGAVLDIVSDRACTGAAVAALTAIHPHLMPVLGIFLLQFMVVDCVLSLSFLAWPRLVSPNYFYRVDRLIWRVNWSVPAKAINTAGVALIVLTGQVPLAFAIAVVQLAVKIWSARRVRNLITNRVDH